MLRTRVIPCLLLSGDGLVKTVQFSNPKYIGDPINAVKIFNDKQVDEIALLDISASKKGCEPNFEVIKKIASEAFMPFSYGGGISSVDQASEILKIGAEKVILNSAFEANPQLIGKIAERFGTQAVVVSIDVKKNFLGSYKLYSAKESKIIKGNVVDSIRAAEALGAGEIILNSVDCDGMQSGYDLELIKTCTTTLSIPVIACGGAGTQNHFKQAVKAGAAAVAAGSMFVFQGKHKAVLISYPSPIELDQLQKEFNE